MAVTQSVVKTQNARENNIEVARHVAGYLNRSPYLFEIMNFSRMALNPEFRYVRGSQQGDKIRLSGILRALAHGGNNIDPEKVNNLNRDEITMCIDNQSISSFNFNGNTQRTMGTGDPKELVAACLTELGRQVDLVGFFHLAKSASLCLPHTLDLNVQGAFFDAASLANTMLLDAGAVKNKRDVTFIVSTEAFQKILKGRISDYKNIQTGYSLETQETKFMMIEGCKVIESQQIPEHIVGNYGGTPTVKGQLRLDNSNYLHHISVNTTGWTPNVSRLLNIGDMITFKGVYGIRFHTASKAPTKYLKTFRVMQTVNSDSNGDATILLSQPIITDASTFNGKPIAPHKNVSNPPPANCPINVIGKARTRYDQYLATSDKPMEYVTGSLEIPAMDGFVRLVHNQQFGASVILSGNYNVNDHTALNAMRMLYGFKVVDEERICRILGDEIETYESTDAYDAAMEAYYSPFKEYSFSNIEGSEHIPVVYQDYAQLNPKISLR